MSIATIAPFDTPNRKTIAQGHPTDCQSPHPKDVYALTVLGGGLDDRLVWCHRRTGSGRGCHRHDYRA